MINKRILSQFKDKKVLVAGGTGTIGIPLVTKLIKRGAQITVVSLDHPTYVQHIFNNKINFIQADLTKLINCLKVTRNQDYIFNLVGIKGSVGIGQTKTASYLVPMLWFQTNLMEAAFRNKVKRFVFVSSICAYPQSSIPKEEGTVWDGMPKQNDRIPGLAKRIGEIQGESYLHEYGWDAVKIVRPANVYGPFDDFNPATAQVIPALISRILSGENPLKVWGDGTAIRDFVFSEDVADGLLKAMEKAPPCTPINLGSGKPTTIKKITQTIVKFTKPSTKIEWDTTKPTGDPIRVLSTKRAKKLLGFRPKTSLDQGIKETVLWYKQKYHYYQSIKSALYKSK